MDYKNVFENHDYACVIVNGEMIRTFEKRDVSDLYKVYTNTPNWLKGASVTDKLIGKAAAALLVLGGVKQVNAHIISTPALLLLQQHGVKVQYNKEVPVVLNRHKSGWCPMERLCYKEASLDVLFEKIRFFVLGLRTKLLGIIFTCLFMGSLASAQSVNDTLDITQKVHQINEVSVTGVRSATDVRKLPLTLSIVTQDQIEARYESSLLPLLSEQVPGLFITSRGLMGYGISGGSAGAMNMRGIGGNPTTGIMVLVDGIPQNMGLFGHPIADIYQSALAERVEVVRGPASVLYGSNAMGGVINVVTPKFKNDTVLTKLNVAYGSYNTLQTGVLNRYQKGRFSSKFSASYNRTDGHRKDLDFEQYSVYEKMAYQLSDEWAIYADVNHTQFTSSNSGPVDALLLDNDADISRTMTALTFENNYDKVDGAFKMYYNQGRHEINDGYAVDAQPQNYLFNSQDNMAGFNLYQTFKVLPDNFITLGADYLTLGGKAWKQFTDNSRFDIIDTTEQEYAVYLDVRQNIGELLTLDAGVRYNDHSQAGDQWIPQVGASLHLPKTLEFKALFSKGFRNPTLKDLYLFPPHNPNLKPEEILNYEVSLSQYLLDNKFKYSLNVFYLEGDNMIQIDFSTGRPLSINTGEVKNYGLEASFNYYINDTWRASANYSWLAMENPVLASPEHKAYAELNYQKKKVKITSGLQYVNGLYTALAPAEQENYWLWNMRASYQFNTAIHTFVKGENLLNQSYEINKGYPMPKANLTLGVACQF